MCRHFAIEQLLQACELVVLHTAALVCCTLLSHLGHTIRNGLLEDTTSNSIGMFDLLLLPGHHTSNNVTTHLSD
jgi:hypothetical protein